jgi:nicotinate-nucleotide pyrophosphorylase (carboxylating)
VEKIRTTVPHTVKVEAKVDNIKGFEQTLEAGADAIVLDNMSVEEIKGAASIAGARVLLEASGGITLESIVEISQTGVNLISVGPTTHSAGYANISLDVISE